MSSLILKPVNASCPSGDPSNGVGPLSRVPGSSRREFVAKQEPILRATVVRDARGELVAPSIHRRGLFLGETSGERPRLRPGLFLPTSSNFWPLSRPSSRRASDFRVPLSPLIKGGRCEG